MTSKPSKRRIIIVDDDDAVRDSLDALLQAEDFQVETFPTATDFLQASCAGAHCILLDVRLPDGDGIDILQKLIAQNITAGVIIMTGHSDVPMAVRAMRVGASDFIEKPFDPKELLQTIERVAEDYEKAAQAIDGAADARERLARLTPRETEVMLQLVQGHPNKIIAYELALSPRTVEVHRARVMEKTKAQSLSELVRLALSAGIDRKTPT
ncbi:MAG: response regulator [Pseudomonadota bacterium]